MGPFSNAPIDTIKTRIQKASRLEGETAFSRFRVVAGDMFRQEGVSAFYKGITPRVMRVAPGPYHHSYLERGEREREELTGCVLFVDRLSFRSSNRLRSLRTSKVLDRHRQGAARKSLVRGVATPSHQRSGQRGEASRREERERGKGRSAAFGSCIFIRLCEGCQTNERTTTTYD